MLTSSFEDQVLQSEIGQQILPPLEDRERVPRTPNAPDWANWVEIDRVDYEMRIRPSKWEPSYVSKIINTIATDLNEKYPKIHKKLESNNQFRSKPSAAPTHERARLSYFQVVDGKVRVGYVVEGMV
uniref:Uncharacterized protein n=1 Tax=viral metagenome TaxID=1070528 RepID=A0A6M3ILF2_9ZZZZ